MPNDYGTGCYDDKGNELPFASSAGPGHAECPRCQNKHHYLDHCIGDFTNTDGSLHILCPDCKEEYCVPQ